MYIPIVYSLEREKLPKLSPKRNEIAEARWLVEGKFPRKAITSLMGGNDIEKVRAYNEILDRLQWRS